ncbi:MAG TPA: hypothetical protein VF941_12225 [Clostridia bacterium]
MNILALISLIIVLLVILVVYISTRKADIYADKIKIKLFKWMDVEISNKAKSSGANEKHPELLE